MKAEETSKAYFFSGNNTFYRIAPWPQSWSLLEYEVKYDDRLRIKTDTMFKQWAQHHIDHNWHFSGGYQSKTDLEYLFRIR
jgi:hypothetical protein